LTMNTIFTVPAAVTHSGKGRRNKCPLNVFTLRLSIIFNLSEVVLKVFYRKQEDSFLKESVNYHFRSHVNWSNLGGEINEDWKNNLKEIQDDARDLKIFEFKDGHWTLIAVI